jgi:hypothetical protein
MKKLILLTVALLLFSGVGNATSNPPTLTIPESGKQEQEQKQEQPYEPKKKTDSDKRGTKEMPLIVEVQDAHEGEKTHNENLIAYSTVVLAVVTALLAWFTFRLWKSTSKLVVGAEKTAERQLRAYVMVPHVTIKNIKRHDGIVDQFFVFITVKNFGQTPATYCTYWVELSAHEFLLKTPLKKPDSAKNSGIGIIAPGDKFTIRTEIPLLSDGGEIHNGRYALYVYGKFNYNDAFGGKQTTDFCFMRNGESWTSDGEMEVCEKGNEAT